MLVLSKSDYFERININRILNFYDGIVFKLFIYIAIKEKELVLRLSIDD